jgi:DNA invertase Pin-like site-specific DNA recombinase
VSLFKLLRSSVEIVSPKHPHVNPPPPLYKVPPTEWPRVVQRVAQGESLRQVARSYGVSYEAIRRILTAARRYHEQADEENLE